METEIAGLGEGALRCGLAYEDRLFDEVIRQRLVDSHTILFTILPTTVHVLHVRPQRQRRSTMSLC